MGSTLVARRGWDVQGGERDKSEQDGDSNEG